MQQQVPNQQTTTQLDTVRFRVWAWLLLATILLGRRLPPDESKDLYALQDNRRIMEKFGGLAARLKTKTTTKIKTMKVNTIKSEWKRRQIKRNRV